ncbi:methyltransferase domain-containing protein [Ditylenchus destructor]|uniref:Methyltransferase domain-containing protein n=1 Tax=Ditylenchus destructor TaxID=166010 RepID=A0AAD4NJJ0_9BILA|nr:methyltransferase domain-containing protein [Ditylenchus destructor]
MDERETIPDEVHSKLKEQQPISDFKRKKLELEAASNWDRFYKRNTDKFFKDRHWSDCDLRQILHDIDLDSELSFLEAGCGVGNMLIPLHDYFPLWSLYGMDFSNKAIEILQQKAQLLGIKAQTLVKDLAVENDEPNPFPPCDIVSLIFVLSAISPEKHESAIRNIKHMVKQGGSVVVRDYAVFDHTMVRFGRGTKISDRFYARQDGTRSYFFTIGRLYDSFRMA